MGAMIYTQTRKRTQEAVREADRAEAEAWSAAWNATRCAALPDDRSTLKWRTRLAGG